MDDFDGYLYSIPSKEAAVTEVASRIEEMQKLYKEMILIAKEYDVRVDFSLNLPDTYGVRGHNQDHYVYWSASAASC